MNEGQYVIVTTEKRGVFFGKLTRYDEEKKIAVLDECMMAIYWGTTKGLFELADTGPTAKSKISAAAPDIQLQLVTSVIGCSAQAVEKWLSR